MNGTFGNDWIIRWGPVVWPLWSSDSNIQIFFRGYLETLVYSTSIDASEILFDIIICNFNEIKKYMNWWRSNDLQFSELGIA